MRLQHRETGEIIDTHPGRAYELLTDPESGYGPVNAQSKGERVGAGPAKAKKKKAAAKKSAVAKKSE